MLKLELVLRTQMKMAGEELRRQKIVGNIQKRDSTSQRELSEGMGVIWLLFACSSTPKKSRK